MIFTISSDNEIDNLYKATNGPFERVAQGYGYYGVLLRHSDSGKIHCHICGKWFKNMGMHSAKKHGVDSESYKERYGFTKAQPLCAVSTSAAGRASGLKNVERLKKFHQDRLESGKSSTQRGKPRKKKWSRSKAFINSHACCPKQIEDRYVAVSERVGHPPSSKDLVRHDVALLSLIKRKHGTFNAFLRKTGLKTPQKGRKTIFFSRAAILLGVRECYKRLGHTPTTIEYKLFHKSRVFKTCSDVTIFKWFGSWNRCLAAAGLR